MKGRCCSLAILIISLLVCSTADEIQSHKLVKRQLPPRTGNERSFPLSRSRQFPPPEELEESEYEDSEDEDQRAPASPFRGRQPPPSEDDYSDEQTYTESPKTTTPAPQKIPGRTIVFNNRLNARPRFGAQFSTKSTSTTAAPTPSTPNSSPRFRATPAQSQRLDVIANILNKPPPPRSPVRSTPAARTTKETPKPKPEVTSVANEPASRRSANTRIRTRGRQRARSTTTTTTTTTTQAPLEEYYYYYEDDEEAAKNPPIATTISTTTTTTTTTPRPAVLPKRPTFNNRRTSGSRNSKPTPKPIKFDLESQFAPPPDEVVPLGEVTSTAPKRFTTSTTTEPPGGYGDIPAHLRHKYKPRTDGRFIDFLRDPNRPRELKGFDLTDYPFYVKVPEDITFDCDDKKDGYYASVPHHCQLFHYCFAGARYDFLCANYTLYDQTTFTCRFANNVDCPSSAKFYYRNDDLWKETTTTSAPETTTKKKRPRPRDYDYEDEYDYEEYDEDEDDAPGRRRRPPPRRRNRRKNKRKQTEAPE